MSTDARSRLAAQAAAAGYPPDLLALIAHATLPAHRDGEQLEDTQIEQVTAAVEVLAQAGYRAESLAEQIADYQRRHGDGLAPSTLVPRAQARVPPLPPPGRLRALTVRDRPRPARPARKRAGRRSASATRRLNPVPLDTERRAR